MGSIAKIENAPQTLAEALRREGDLVVLTPISETKQMNEFFSATVSVLAFSPEKEKGDAYPVEGGRLSHTKPALMQIAAAAGIDILDTEVIKSEPDHCIVKAKGRVRKPSGEWRSLVGIGEINTNIPGYNDAQTKKFLLRKTETAAILRMIRQGLAIKPSYTREDFAKPLAIPSISFTPDMTNPEIARLVIASAMGATISAYGPQAIPPGGEDAHAALTAGSHQDDEGAPIQAEVVEERPEVDPYSTEDSPSKAGTTPQPMPDYDNWDRQTLIDTVVPMARRVFGSNSQACFDFIRSINPKARTFGGLDDPQLADACKKLHAKGGAA